jgi:hypothetical protein
MVVSQKMNRDVKSPSCALIFKDDGVLANDRTFDIFTSSAGKFTEGKKMQVRRKKQPLNCLNSVSLRRRSSSQREPERWSEKSPGSAAQIIERGVARNIAFDKQTTR